MDRYEWGTKGCPNKIKYYNELEECYYCKNWTICMFKEGEWAKIGSLNTIKQLLTLSKSVVDELYEYVVDEHLETKWKLALKQHKEFLCELVIINQELNEALKTGKFKDLAKIQQRAFCLKSNITENEVYLKYLLHKEMNKHRLKCHISNSNTIISNVCDDDGKVGNEDENNLLWRNKDLKILVDPKLSTNLEDGVIKENSCEEINYNLEDKLHSENERDKLLEKIIDVELESDSIKQTLIEVNNKSDKCDTIN